MAAMRPRDTVEDARSLTDTLVWLLYCAASYLAGAFVRAIDNTRAAVLWLDPRIHFASLRIRSVTDGGKVKNTNKCAILVIYSNGSLPIFIRSVIGAFERSEFDLVVVSNGLLDADVKADLIGRCCLLIERANVGRDFGGYQDGITIVQRKFPQLQKLLLANDSVIYLPHGLDDLIAELAGEGEITGVSEIFEHHYHVASFLVSFGRAVLDSAAFRDFWIRYRPVGTRRWAILRGEGALTARLVAAGFRTRVLYQTDMLRRRLERLPADRLLDEARSLPARAYRELKQMWSGVEGVGSAAAGTAGIAADIAGAIHARNQMHYGGFLFRRHLGLPVIKRDLVYRGIYSLPDVLDNITDIEAPLRDAIAIDFQARPKPANYGLLRRLFHRHGAI